MCFSFLLFHYLQRGCLPHLFVLDYGSHGKTLILHFFVCYVTGIAFAILGMLLFMPGFYYTRIAYYAYKGYKGFSFSNIPAV